jgi:lipopolysaccharide/colanic/teichoic acid biosynthesis glycosyltransferase
VTRPLERGLSTGQRTLKRTFDLLVAGAIVLLIGWLVPVAAIAARWSTGGSGLFRQARVGRDGQMFNIIKLRTMRVGGEACTTVTAAGDPRITRFGHLLRRTKLDELPQVFNVLAGHMSFVGPRPDVPGYADALVGDDRIVLSVRPGVTGPATLLFRHEESLLETQPEPERYNREVIWPEKVRVNRAYVEGWRFRDDLRYLWRTLLPASTPTTDPPAASRS